MPPSSQPGTSIHLGLLPLLQGGEFALMSTRPWNPADPPKPYVLCALGGWLHLSVPVKQGWQQRPPHRVSWEQEPRLSSSRSVCVSPL